MYRALGAGLSLCTHVGNGLSVVLGLEDTAAADHDVRTSRGDPGDVVHLDAAVDLDIDVQSAFVDERAQCTDFIQHRGNECLSAKNLD